MPFNYCSQTNLYFLDLFVKSQVITESNTQICGGVA